MSSLKGGLPLTEMEKMVVGEQQGAERNQELGFEFVKLELSAEECGL